VRGSFDGAAGLKLRVQRAETLRPGTISAPIAGHCTRRWSSIPQLRHSVRVADLAAWERPAPELIALAIDNVNDEEGSAGRWRLLVPVAVSVRPCSWRRWDWWSKFSSRHHSVRRAGRDAERHSCLCHAIADARSLGVLRQCGRALSLEGGPRRSARTCSGTGDRFVPFRSCARTKVKSSCTGSSTSRVRSGFLIACTHRRHLAGVRDRSRGSWDELP